ncbi:MAG: thioredoxin family protein [Burkholderiales bacterium]
MARSSITSVIVFFVGTGMAMPLLSDGLVVFVKRDCPTCIMVEPVIQSLDRAGRTLVVCAQDDPSFPSAVRHVINDTSLEWSFRYAIDTVPTVVRMSGGKEVDRAVGWEQADWSRVTNTPDIGSGLPPWRPGCGSLTTAPGVAETLLARFGDPAIKARKIEVSEWDDPIEACFDRGWSDGLPVVPPTDDRILRMLKGTTRKAGELIGAIPPNLMPCTIEKVAINAVMAGCKPEYMPVLLTALEAALEPKFTLHGLTCSTCFSSPIIVVNGPVAKAIGMNWGVNVLGQGNRANATIGRALNLVVRNVGGGIPGGIDRATIGGPHKIGLCFAEDETDPAWVPLAVARGVAPGKSAVTLFQGDAMQGFVDQRSRTPEELTRSLAMALFAAGHPKLCEFVNAMLVLGPEHYAIYHEAGWDRPRIQAALHAALKRPGRELVMGAHGVGEGIPADRAEEVVDKFWPEGLLIVRAGGDAGFFSAILAGWTGGRFRAETQPITREVHA